MPTSRSVRLKQTKKPLVFIFHDATDSNAGANKAAVNSHIAKTAHYRRKQTKALQHCSCVAYDCAHLHPEQIGEPIKHQMPAPVTIPNSSFDPFNPIQGVTSRQDKALLQLYFVEMPRAIYGTHQNAAFCPVRDGAYKWCHTDKITLQWTLLSAEVYVSARNPAYDQTSIFRRKTYAYHLMGQRLADPAKRYSVDATASFGAAALAETRWGDFAKAKMHFDAVKFIIDKTGGPYAVQAMPLSHGVILLLVYLAMEAYQLAVFPSYTAFEQVKRCFIDTLMGMQSWHRSNMQRCQYLIPPESALHNFVGPASPLQDPVSVASHFVILYNLNFTLFDLRHDTLAAATFLKDFLHDVESGSIPCAKECTLKPTTVVLILANRASLAGEKRELIGGLWRSWKVIDVMRLMRLVDTHLRSRLLNVMSSWITGEEVKELDEEDVRDIENSMEINWLKMI